MNVLEAKTSVYLRNDVVTTSFVTGGAQKTILIGGDLDLGRRLSMARPKRRSFQWNANY